MNLCQQHWNGLRQAIDDRGLSHLVSRDGEELVRRITQPEPETAEAAGFDPLMGAYMAILTNALEHGGSYLLANNEASTDGHYCAICEAEKHGGRPASWWYEHAADEQLERARELGLVQGAT